MDIHDQISSEESNIRKSLQEELQGQMTKQLSGEAPEMDEPAGFQFSSQTFFYGDAPAKKNTYEFLRSAVGWVYSCVSAIADAVSKVEIKLFRTNETGEVEQVFDHPILELLYRVNSQHTQYDHLWMTQQYLELTGEAPWFVDRGENGDEEPKNILLLRPDLLEVKKNKDEDKAGEAISSYVYRLNSTNEIPIKNSELVFLKYPDPTNSFRGKGTLQAAATTVDIDTFSEEWNKRFFYNSARPDSILSTEKTLSNKQRKVLESELKRLYQGKENAHKTAVLEAGMEWKPMQLSQKDMEFFQQQNFTLTKILAIFRVPKAIVGISDDVNLANAKIGEYVFAKWTIAPKLSRIVGQLNEFLLPMFDGTENMFLSFSDPVPQDTDAEMKRIESGLGKGWMTINEVRAEQELDDIGPDGDLIYYPNQFSTLDNIAQPPGAFGNLGIKVSKDIKNKARINKSVGSRSGGAYHRIVNRIRRDKKIKQSEDAETKKVEEAVTKTLSKIESIGRSMVTRLVEEKRAQKKLEQEDRLEHMAEVHKTFGQMFIKAADEYERMFFAQTARQFRRQKRMILEETKAVKNGDFFLNLDEETEIFVEAFLPAFREIVKDQGDRAGLLAGLGAGTFNEATSRVQKFLKERTFRFSHEVNEETNKLIGEQLAAGVAQGEGIPQLRTRVAGLFDGMERTRAERIARSEVIRASNFGATEAYRQSGRVKGVQWLTTDDNRTCPFCAPLDGKTIKLGGNFFDRGETVDGTGGAKFDLSYESIKHPPLHPNCRCTVVPIIK